MGQKIILTLAIQVTKKKTNHGDKQYNPPESVKKLYHSPKAKLFINDKVKTRAI